MKQACLNSSISLPGKLCKHFHQLPSESNLSLPALRNVLGHSCAVVPYIGIRQRQEEGGEGRRQVQSSRLLASCSTSRRQRIHCHLPQAHLTAAAGVGAHTAPSVQAGWSARLPGLFASCCLACLGSTMNGLPMRRQVSAHRWLMQSSTQLSNPKVQSRPFKYCPEVPLPARTLSPQCTHIITVTLPQFPTPHPQSFVSMPEEIPLMTAAGLFIVSPLPGQ